MKSIFILVQSIACFGFSKHLLLFLSAINLHVCAIDWTQSIFDTDFTCNRFTLLCNWLHTQNIWNLMQSIYTKVAIDCMLHNFEKQQLYTYLFITPFHGNLSLNLSSCSWFIYRIICCFKRVIWTYKYSFSKWFQHLFQLYFLNFQK